jgi:hypothetical protein
MNERIYNEPFSMMSMRRLRVGTNQGIESWWLEVPRFFTADAEQPSDKQAITASEHFVLEAQPDISQAHCAW